MKNAINSGNRKLHMDLLRIIAILFVIYTHTEENGYYLYAFDCPIYLKVIYIATSLLVAVAVPIFFMISGALLIDKEESLKDLYLKRVLRMVIVLLLFSVIQYVYQHFMFGEQLSVKVFIQSIIGSSIPPKYWFLYAYIAYLCGLPLLRKLAKAMTDKDYKYLFVLFLIVEGVLAAVAFFVGVDEINGFFAIPFFNRVIIYPLLGYYLEKKVPQEKYNKKGLGIWILAMIAVLVFMVAMTLVRNLPYEEFTIYDKGLFTSGFTIVLCAGVYYIIKMLFIKGNAPKALSNVLVTLSSTVFGVFLIENIIRDTLMPVYYAIASVIGKYLGCWVYVIFTFLVGAVIIFIIKLIPGVKKFL